MTKREIYQMEYDSGMTERQIAEKHGVTRQAIYALLAQKPAHNRLSKERCIYPAISDFMYDNRLNVTQMEKLAGLKNNTLYRILRGDGGLTKENIDKLIACTGLTYEVLFATD